MDVRPEVVQGDEVSLLDIYDFLRDGWVTLIGAPLLGALIGLLVSFVMPVKYQASGLIEPARVGGEFVETAATLTEKLRNPSYYVNTTFESCQLSDEADPAEALIKNLSPRVERESSFVAIKYDAVSPALAKECLTAVIGDVKKDEETLTQSPRAEIESKIRSVRLHLTRADELRNQQIALNKQRLAVARQKLAAAQAFVSEFEARTLQFDFRNDQFSASSLLLATLESKQSEVKDLQLQIDELDMLVRSGLTKLDSEVLEIELELAELNKSLEKPATQDARFALPIFASDTKVAPRRSLIAAIGLFAGGFFGLLILIARRSLKHIQQSEAARRAKAS